MKIAISIGDLNGIGLEIALKSHEEIKKYATPVYCIGEKMLEQGASLLDLSIPDEMILEPITWDFAIKPGKITVESGHYSFDSFMRAVRLACQKKVDAVVTLPIHKEAWHKAGIAYRGHTDALRDIFKKEAIMMLGCEKLYVALFTEHIPLKEVPKQIKTKPLKRFLLDFYKETFFEPIGVLGLNPHAGDGGVLGDEEEKIKKAIQMANKKLGKEIFFGPLVPDTAFTPANRKVFSRIVAMYHDQGLAALKALYFEESINVSLNLPIVRASVDHGTAFDIAYQNKNPSLLSYQNAIKAACALAKSKVFARAP